MALMSAQEYIESLRKLNTRVYMFGEKLDNWVDHPMIRPSIHCVAMTYALAQDPQYAGGSAASGQEPGNDRKKKESGFGKKLAVSAACALVFGAVAGVTMTGVNRVMIKSGAETQAAIEQSAESRREILAVWGRLAEHL